MLYSQLPLHNVCSASKTLLKAAHLVVRGANFCSPDRCFDIVTDQECLPVNTGSITRTFHQVTTLIYHLPAIRTYLRRKYWQVGGLFTIFDAGQDVSETATFWPASKPDDGSSTN